MGTVAAGCLICAALVLLVRTQRQPALRSRATIRPLLLGRPTGRWPVGRVAGWAAAGTVGCAAGLVAGPVAAALAGVSSALLGRRFHSVRAAAAAAAARSAEVEALAALAAELRSGRQPGEALASVQAPAGTGVQTALRAAHSAAALGGDVATALQRDAPAGGLLERLAAAWQVSEVTGASLAAVVERVDVEARGEAAARLKAQVEMAGARATGGLLAGLPLLGVALGQAMGARPLHVLLHTPLGALCAGSGLALEIAGLAWVSRLAASAIEP